jgi:hypothetical protein
MLLQLSTSVYLDDLALCSLSAAFFLHYHTQQTPDTRRCLNPFRQEEAILNRISTEIGSSMGQSSDAIYKGHFPPFSLLRSNSQVDNSEALNPSLW